MKTRSILIGTCLIGSLVGLGFLAHYVYGDKQPKGKQKKNVPSKKTKSDIHGHPIRKTPPPPNNSDSPDGYRNQEARRAKKPIPIVPKTVKTKKPQLPPQEKSQLKAELSKEQLVTPPIADEFPLRLGSKGKRVERLQIWLMRNYGWTGKITDVFDQKTQTLVKRFLKKPKLDKATYYHMKMEKPVHLQSPIR